MLSSARCALSSLISLRACKVNRPPSPALSLAGSTRSASDLACARSTLTHAQLHLLWLARPAPAQIIKLHWLAGSAAGAREGPNPTSTSPSTKTQRAVPTHPRSPPSPLPLSAAPFHHSTIPLFSHSSNIITAGPFKYRLHVQPIAYRDPLTKASILPSLSARPIRRQPAISTRNGRKGRP